MKKITFITGGARSGKSDFAERIATANPAPWLYVATAEALDDEMRSRIEQHKRRRGSDWHLAEEPLRLHRVLGAVGGGRYGAVLIDCLTLWLTNVMLSGLDVRAESVRLIEAMRDCPASLYVVSNEVGLGIVPVDELGRRFRDEAGRLNQQAAQVADEAYMVVSGIPMKLK